MLLLLTKGVVYLVGLSYIISNVSKIKEKKSVHSKALAHQKKGVLKRVLFKTLNSQQ